MFLLSVFVFVVLNVCKSSDLVWDYHENGPDTWANMEGTECGGTQQSPINIIDTSLIKNSNLNCKNKILNWNINENHKRFRVENNGHALEVTPIDENNEELSINNRISSFTFNHELFNYNNQNEKYVLSQLHFHFGENDNEGSEHTINDKHYPMELHLVHRSINSGDRLSVISILFKIGKTNPSIDTLINPFTIDKLRKAGNDLIEDNSNIIHLIPKEISKMYLYSGSLTTPPCSEIVRWIVLPETISISEDQLDLFRSLKDSHGVPIGEGNYRPVQNNQNQVYIFDENCQESKD